MGESSLIEGGKDWQVDFLDAVKVKWKKIVVQMKKIVILGRLPLWMVPNETETQCCG